MTRKKFIESGVLFHIIDTGAELHSFHDLNLILAPFTYTPAKPKENFLDIPGGNGSVDLTEALGEVKYYDREFTFTFSVFPQDDMTFEERQSFVSAELNGKRCKITLDKDPDFYWEGRCRIDEYKCDKRLRQIVITATVKPYKMMHNETVVSVDLDELVEAVIYLTNRRKSVVPVIECTGTVQISTEGNGRDLEAGTYKMPEFQLKRGNTQFYLVGEGIVTFTYREGEL